MRIICIGSQAQRYNEAGSWHREQHHRPTTTTVVSMLRTAISKLNGGASASEPGLLRTRSAASVGYRQGACWQSQRNSILSPACLQ